ncbi:hypothetical protein TWF718_000208 [Orbilia javanica]|uniref:Uncharacterized protein n=1 Tax=Orbilia javanica TaxID=47235 RepID=A0AAN8N432_9PEZI
MSLGLEPSGAGHYIEVDNDPTTGTSEYDSLYGTDSASATTSLIDSVKGMKFACCGCIGVTISNVAEYGPPCSV